MTRKNLNMRACAPAKRALLALAPLMLAACASDTAPQRYAGGLGDGRSAAPTDHTAAQYLPRDMASVRQSMIVSLGRDDIADFVFTAAPSHRAAVGLESDPASAAHEAAFASASPGDPVGKLRNGAAPAQAHNILVQNQMSGEGGWRQVGGAMVHDYSGMRCPVKLDMTLTDENGVAIESVSAPLSRINLYNASGQDTSCDYANADAGVYLTLYASNWPTVSLQDHFASALKLIVDRFPLKEEAPVLVMKGDPYANSQVEGETLTAGYITEPMLNGGTFKTALWLNKAGPWHVKVRATFLLPAEGGLTGPKLVEMVAATMHAVTLKDVDLHGGVSQTVSFDGE